jgi:hypothetical protein
MRIRSAVEVEDPAAGAEATSRERRIKAGYRRLLRAVLDGKGGTERLKAKGSRLKEGRKAELPSAEWRVRSAESGGRGSKFSPQRSAAAEYLSGFLCAALALALLVTGCAGPRPLKGGKAVVTRSPGGSVEQTLSQSENPAQATKQEQESVKVRTFVVPAGSRMETGPAPGAPGTQPASPAPARISGQECPRSCTRPTTPGPQPSTTLTLSAPMPVTEREETRERTELGAAQKDMAREVGAKLASLKGIVWVGVGLFVFGLASLVWPPLKVVIGSVTTSAAVMLGGIALMVLPSLIVGNELLILGVVGLAVGGWFLAHRHGELRGRVGKSEGRSPKDEGQSQSPSSVVSSA